MRKVVAEKQQFERRELAKAEARERFTGDPLKLERLEEFSDDEVISIYTNGPFVDLCRGPHVPDTSALKHFKLLSTRRRLLARRREAADAAAHLRHGVVPQGGPGGATCTAWRRRSGATTARSGQELDLFSTDAARGARAHPLAPAGRHGAQRDRELRARADPAPRLRAGLHAAHRQREAVRDLGAPAERSSENMFGAMEVEGHALPPEADELPRAHLHLPEPTSARIATCPSATPSSAPSTATSGAACCTACCACAASRRTTPTCSARREQVETELGRLLDLVDEMLAVFGYPYTIELSTRPEKALGTAEVWEQAEKTLAERARGARPGVHAWTRAAARSTAPSSTSS